MQGRSQDLVSGGGTHFGGGRPPIFRLRPQITRVPPYVFLATPGFRGGGGLDPLAPPLYVCTLVPRSVVTGDPGSLGANIPGRVADDVFANYLEAGETDG